MGGSAPLHRRLSGGAQALVLAVGVRALGIAALAVAAHVRGYTAHARLERWDANWYGDIAAHGYGFTRVLPDGRHLSDYAFFPLYPALERMVHEVTGLGFKDSGLVVSWLATGVAVWGVFAVGERVAGRRAGVVLAGMWAAAPIAVVLTMAYSEALFTALAAWALYAVLSRRLVLAACLAVLAGLTRPLGAAVAAAVVTAAVLEYRASRLSRADRADGSSPVDARAVLRLLGVAALSVSGWIGYVGWVGLRRHALLGYFDVQAGWGNGVDGGRAFALWGLRRLLDVQHPVRMGEGMLILVGVLAAVALIVTCIRDRLPAPVIVYTVTAVVISFATARYFGSKPRYLLPAFPLLLPLATRLGSPTRGRVVLASLTVVSTAVGTVMLLGSGPP